MRKILSGLKYGILLGGIGGGINYWIHNLTCDRVHTWHDPFGPIAFAGGLFIVGFLVGRSGKKKKNPIQDVQTESIEIKKDQQL
ncbi:MAG TPA: hypothetical protein VF868_16140 [Bacteroidia bacterium]|jgi:hypothetical protein